MSLLSGSAVLLLLFWGVCCVSSRDLKRSHLQQSFSDEDRGPFPSHRGQLASGQQEKECVLKVGNFHESSLPAGRTDVDYINQLLVDASTEEGLESCIRQCCQMGSRHCQYVWLFTGKCYTIACTPQNADKCLPHRMSVLSSSVYVAVRDQPGLEEVKKTSVGPTPETIMDTTSMDVFGPATPPTVSHHPLMTPPPPLTTPPSPLTTPPPSPLPSPLTTPPPSPLPASTIPHPTHQTSQFQVQSKATPPNSPSHPALANNVVVSFAGDRELTLPEDSTRLFSSTWPRPQFPQRFLYQWEKLSGPNEGTLSGIDRKELELAGLVAGVYMLKLSVRSNSGDLRGEAMVNVTVHPAVRKNSPPIPVISPSSHTTVVLPHNSALFDASGSHDDKDSGSLQFHWEEVTGPVDTDVSSDSPVLQLANLKQGDYKYKLTVTDEDGVSAVAYAAVTVKPELYYPPQASAGKDQLLKLPNDEVTLDGSRSSAFKGNLQYKWEKLFGPGAVDMKGSNTPMLHLQHISSTGDYLFRLTVTDSQGQSSASNVSVVVLPEHNLPPEANAGPDVEVQFPETRVFLNGSSSSDDYRIDEWTWTQLSGPNIALNGKKSPVLEVKGLHIDESTGSPTVYVFQLCVRDYHNLTDTANVTIVYRKDPKIPPSVAAGGPVNITLPQNTVILNGSSSSDDFGIASYQWVRSEHSPAAGLVVNHSDHQAVLILSDLVEGVYNYTLRVSSTQGMVASDAVTINVLPNPMKKHLLQIHIEGDASTFTKAKMRQLERVLSLILDDVDVDYDITIQRVQAMGPHFMVEFYASRRDDHTPMNATVAYMKLTDKGQDYYYPNSDFHFVKISMKVCQLPCSGHGSCDPKTHWCSCSRYWMENPFKALFGKKVTNCDWSIFYVVLGVLLSIAAILFLIWLACCCCMRRHRMARAKRRVRYAILDRKDVEERRQMLPYHDDAGYQQSSLMVSESETEEEILFQSKKDQTTANGSVPASSEVQIRTHRLTNGNGRISNSA